MFSPASISKKVEKMRKEDPYALTARNVITGTMVTKGPHLFIDRNHEAWKNALRILVNQMQETMDVTGATKLMLRDFIGAVDVELERVLLELGLVSYRLLNNCIIEDLSWKSQAEYLNQLSQKYRYNVRKEILKFKNYFMVDCLKPQNSDEIEDCYQLYSNVFEKALDLNVFKLPKSYFKAMCTDYQYDMIKLYLNPAFVEGIEKPILVGVMFSQINGTSYNAMIVGLNYEYVVRYNSYKQIMYQALLRAKELNCTSLDLAYTAEMTKKKLGARLQDVRAYVQAKEHYSYQILDAM